MSILQATNRQAKKSITEESLNKRKSNRRSSEVIIEDDEKTFKYTIQTSSSEPQNSSNDAAALLESDDPVPRDPKMEALNANEFEMNHTYKERDDIKFTVNPRMQPTKGMIDG